MMTEGVEEMIQEIDGMIDGDVNIDAKVGIDVDVGGFFRHGAIKL